MKLIDENRQHTELAVMCKFGWVGLLLSLLDERSLVIGLLEIVGNVLLKRNFRSDFRSDLWSDLEVISETISEMIFDVVKSVAVSTVGLDH